MTPTQRTKRDYGAVDVTESMNFWSMVEHVPVSGRRGDQNMVNHVPARGKEITGVN